MLKVKLMKYERNTVFKYFIYTTDLMAVPIFKILPDLAGKNGFGAYPASLAGKLNKHRSEHKIQ